MREWLGNRKRAEKGINLKNKKQPETTYILGVDRTKGTLKKRIKQESHIGKKKVGGAQKRGGEERSNCSARSWNYSRIEVTDGNRVRGPQKTQVG